MFRRIKENNIYIISFLIPWAVVFTYAFLKNGWPVGDGSILSGDAGLQLYQLCVELWNKVHSGHSLFYSWNAGGGFDFYLNMVYYLISPFTLLILAVPKNWLMNTVQVVMILKWSFMYISMLYYYMHTKSNRLTGNSRKLISFVVAGIYALSNSIILKVVYFNWNDVLILFPLILLALEDLIENNNWKKYSFLLWAAIICNFYTAYQLCIFMVIWFVFMTRPDTKDLKKKIIVFIGSSLLSVLSSMIVILPSVMGARNRYSDYFESAFESVYNNTFLVSVRGVITKLFFMDDISDIWNIYPGIYFSIGAMTLVILSFTLKNTDRGRKLLLLVLMLSGLFINKISLIWHGFSQPHGAYHRFLYLIIFVCSYIVMDMMQNIESYSWVLALVVGLAWMFVMLFSFINIREFQDFYVYLITILLYAFYEIIIVLYGRKSIKKKHFIVICSVLIMAEMFVNAVYEFQNYDRESIMSSDNTHDASVLSKKVKLSKSERVCVVQGRDNDGLLFDIPCDDIFLSYCNGNNVKFHQGFGMDYADAAKYGLYGSSPLLNLIFNLRYGVGDNEMYFSDTKNVDSEGDLKLFETSRLAGLGYMTDSGILDWNGPDNGPFESQNDFCICSTGIGGIFDIVKPQINCTAMIPIHENPEMTDEGYYVYDYTSAMIKDMEYTYIQFKADEDMDMYVMANNGAAAMSAVFINDELVLKDSDYHIQQTFHIGNVHKGDDIKIYATHNLELGESNTMRYQIAKFNENAYQEVYERLSKDVLNIEEMNDSYIKGNIDVTADGIMMTSVQALDGFSVYVDGEKCEYKTIGNTYIGIPLNNGKHTVEFKYITPFFMQSVFVSIIGVVIYILVCVYPIDRVKIIQKNAE